MKNYLLVLSAICFFFGTTALAKKKVEVNIIPQPQKVTINKGWRFNAKGKDFYASPNFDEQSKMYIDRFASQLSLITERVSTTNLSSPKNSTIPKRGFIFIKDDEIKKESYTIKSSYKSLIVRASDSNGILYAIQTIKQLLPPAIYGDQPASNLCYKIPALYIEDSPRFDYRGFHLDVARHFYSVKEIKKMLDHMVMYKMNRFHWHLTEDQGWRLEIKKYPKLTEVGAYRNGTVIKKDWDSNDGIRYGGFYTQEQVKEVIKYAKDRGIVVIPEIDLPGHMLAALASYPELGCTGGPYEVWKRWGVSEDVLCIGKPQTMQFLKDVLAEVIELFPSEYIHIGGDECPKVRWKTCERCQNLIKELGLKEVKGHSKEVSLQNYVTTEIQKFVNSKGRKIIGWDEILEGDLAKGATVMSWRGVKGGIQAAKQGYDAIMTPDSYLYYDHYQSKEFDKEPFAIGGYLPIEKVYSYEPYEGLPESAYKHILGVQANLWTEYIASNEHLEYMTAPRAAALSELQWTRPENKNFERFVKSLNKHKKIYDVQGFVYAKHLWGKIGLPGKEQNVSK